MPRLVGKQSNRGLYVGLVVLAVIAGFGSLEYAGIINLIPGFGQERASVIQKK